MLLVNNSPRCRLRSLRPSHLIQSEAFTQSSDWRKHGENTGSSANEVENTSLFFSVYSSLIFLSFSACGLRKPDRLGGSKIPSRSPVSPSFCYLKFPYVPSLSLSFSPYISRCFRVKEKWKTSSPSTSQLVEKGINLGLKFRGQTWRKTTSERGIEVQVEGHD